MFKEIISSVKQVILERVFSPIFGTFIVAWCVTNWDGIAVFIFGHEDIYRKIELVESYSDWLKRLVIPVTATLAYVFGYPWIKHFAYTYHVWVTERLTLKKLQVDNKVLDEKKSAAQKQVEIDSIFEKSKIALAHERSMKELEIETRKQRTRGDVDAYIQAETSKKRLEILREMMKEIMNGNLNPSEKIAALNGLFGVANG